MLRTEIRYFLFLRLTESIHIGRLLEIGGSNQDTKVWKLRKLNVIMILQIFRGINTAYSMYQITTSIGFTNFFFEWEQYFVISKLWFFYNVCTYFAICITTLTFLRPKTCETFSFIHSNLQSSFVILVASYVLQKPFRGFQTHKKNYHY